MTLENFKFVYIGIRSLYKEMLLRSTNIFRLYYEASELIRNTHSIKGLSIAEPRLGFGHKKQLEMLKRIKFCKIGIMHILMKSY